MMRKTTLLMLLCLLCFNAQNMYSQSTEVSTAQRSTALKKITGIIRDAKGESIVGATIRVAGTTQGTITDVSGKFSIDAPAGSTLEISFMGFVTQNIKVGSQSKLKITLIEDTQSLDEVVVVGYGTQKKVNLTGSVASVEVAKMIESRPVTNISNALTGMVAGLYVNTSDNKPGNAGNSNLLIRGTGTLNSSSPLVIVDGVEQSMSSVSPQDVANISVLKDAASASIYGSRAANGVILITTKKGKSGSLKVNYSGYTSIESINKNALHFVSNYADYMGYINEGYANSNQKNDIQSKHD